MRDDRSYALDKLLHRLESHLGAIPPRSREKERVWFENELQDYIRVSTNLDDANVSFDEPVHPKTEEAEKRRVLFVDAIYGAVMRNLGDERMPDEDFEESVEKIYDRIFGR